MISASLCVLLLGSPSFTGGARRVAEPGAPTDVPSPPSSDSAPDALEQLQKAQSAASEGRIDDALVILDRALVADDTVASIYLMRAQLLLGRLPELEGFPPVNQEIDPRWPGWARLAASDIERYLALTGTIGEARTEFESYRAQLLDAAELAERALADEGAEQAEPDEGEESVEPPRPSGPDRLAVGLLAGGSVLTAIGATFMGGAVRIEPRCRETDCVDARWRGYAPWLGPGLPASLLGAGLVTTGATLLARRGHASGLRRRRVVGAALLASAGAVLVGGALTGGLAIGRWNGFDANAETELSTTQRLGNASLTLVSMAPALLGGGIGLMLRPRDAARR